MKRGQNLLRAVIKIKRIFHLVAIKIIATIGGDSERVWQIYLVLPETLPH